MIPGCRFAFNRGENKSPSTPLEGKQAWFREGVVSLEEGGRDRVVQPDMPDMTSPWLREVT